MKIKSLLVGIVLIVSCNSYNPNEKLVVGNWQAVSWVDTNNKPLEKTEKVGFSFKEGKYKYDNDTLHEKGTYKVENDMLFTTADGQREIMVKIVKASSDSLVFGMNNGGNSEFLTLVRKK